MARMELPVLDKFCFIFDLKTGCLVMGILNSIFTFLAAVILIVFAADIKEASKLKDDDSMSSVVYTIIILLVILQIVKFLMELMFIYAVYKGKCGLIKKYCIFWMVFLVLFSISFLKALFHMSAGHVIALLIFLAENVYFIVVIRSYLRSMNEDGVI